MKLVYFKVNIPIISDREVYIEGMGIDRFFTKKSIYILARSIDKD